MRDPALHSPGRRAVNPYTEISPRIQMQISHDLELTVGGTQFLLIPNQEVMVCDMKFGGIETNLPPELSG